MAVMGEDGEEQCKFDNLTRPYLWDGNNTELPMYNPMQQYGDAGRDVRAHWHCRACALGAACVGTRTVRPRLFYAFLPVDQQLCLIQMTVRLIKLFSTSIFNC